MATTSEFPENRQVFRSETEELFTNAQALFAGGQFDATVDACEKVIARNRRYTEACVLAGEACMLLAKIPEAEGYFQQAVNLEPKNGERYFDLGNSQFAQGDVDGAHQNYAMADRLGCSDEIRVKLYYLLGMIGESLSEFETALAQYERIESVPGANLEESLLRRIYIYVETGDPQNAERLAVRLKRKNPDQFKYYQLLFQTVLQQEDAGRAEGVLLQAEQHCTLDVNTQADIVFDRVWIDCLRAQQEPDQLEQYYDTAMGRLQELLHTEDLPTETRCQAYIIMAQMDCKLERVKDAIACALSACECDPDDGPDETLKAMVEQAWVILVECCLLTGEFEQAQQFAAQLKASGNFIYQDHGYYSEAFAAKKRGDPEAGKLYHEAIAFFKKCLEEEPDDSIAATYLVKAYADVGEYEKARALGKGLPADAWAVLQGYIQQMTETVAMDS